MKKQGELWMRILVLSDSHRHVSNLFAAIQNEPDAEIVYFLGDGLHEAEEAVSVFKDKKFFVLVRGNFDFGENVAFSDIKSVDLSKISASHVAE